MSELNKTTTIAIITGIFVILGALIGSIIQCNAHLSSSKMVVQQSKIELINKNASKEYDKIEDLFSKFSSSLEGLLDILIMDVDNTIKINEKLTELQIISKRFIINTDDSLSLATIELNKDLIQLIKQRKNRNFDINKFYLRTVEWDLVVRNKLKKLKTIINDFNYYQDDKIKSRSNSNNTLITLLSSLLSGVIALTISLFYYRRYEKRKAKWDTVKKFARYRYDLKSDEFTRTLNEIFIIFNESEKVINSLINFHDKVVKNEVNNDEFIILFKALCEEVNINLNKFDKSFFLKPFNTKMNTV